MSKQLSRDWCFTVLNPTETELELLRVSMRDKCRFGFIAKKENEAQCYVCMSTLKSRRQIEQMIPESGRVTNPRLRNKEEHLKDFIKFYRENSATFEQFGVMPVQGKRPETQQTGATRQLPQEDLIQIIDNFVLQMVSLSTTLKGLR